jgi:hypothetical protein
MEIWIDPKMVLRDLTRVNKLSDGHQTGCKDAEIRGETLVMFRCSPTPSGRLIEIAVDVMSLGKQVLVPEHV